MKPSQKMIKLVARKKVKEWFDTNKSFVEDFEKLINEMITFELKYGVKIYYQFNDPLIAVEEKNLL